MDGKKAGPGGDEKPAGKIEVRKEPEIQRIDKLKRTPPGQRRGSVGATPSEGYKEWFENLLRPITDGRMETNSADEMGKTDLTRIRASGEKKRLRQEESPTSSMEKRTKKWKTAAPTVLAVEEALENMCNQIEQIGKIITETHNPKSELKDTVAKLVYQCESLRNLKTALQEQEADLDEQTTSTLGAENENLKAKLQKM